MALCDIKVERFRGLVSRLSDFISLCASPIDPSCALR